MIYTDGKNIISDTLKELHFYCNLVGISKENYVKGNVCNEQTPPLGYYWLGDQGEKHIEICINYGAIKVSSDQLKGIQKTQMENYAKLQGVVNIFEAMTETAMRHGICFLQQLPDYIKGKTKVEDIEVIDPMTVENEQ